MSASSADSPDAQGRSLYWAARAAVAARVRSSRRGARRGTPRHAGRGVDDPVTVDQGGFAVAAAAALELGDLATVDELLALGGRAAPGPPATRAGCPRVARPRPAGRSRAGRRGRRPRVRPRHRARSPRWPASFWAAAARVEWAELLSRARRDRRCGGGRRAGAPRRWRSLGATPWLDRLHGAGRRRSRPRRDALGAISGRCRWTVPVGAPATTREGASPARS